VKPLGNTGGRRKGFLPRKGQTKGIKSSTGRLESRTNDKHKSSLKKIKCALGKEVYTQLKKRVGKEGTKVRPIREGASGREKEVNEGPDRGDSKEKRKGP